MCPFHDMSRGKSEKEDGREEKVLEEKEEGDIQQRTKSEFHPTRIRKHKPLLQQLRIQRRNSHQKLN